MTKRIFHSICLVALTVFLASIILVMGVLYNYFSNVSQAQLKMQTDLAAQGVINGGMEYFHNLKTANYRITWIDADGAVLYDSESNTEEMENHLEREEVIEAFSTGYGESKRYSVTLMERSLYSAQMLPDGTILRLSISQRSIVTLIFGMVQPICAIIAIAVVLSILLAMRISKKIVKPLNEIDLDKPLSNEGYDELSPLLRRIDSQQRQLRRQEIELHRKQDELDTIIGSMNEGMILLNRKGKIMSINSAAIKLLEADQNCVGADMLSVSRNLDLQEILSTAFRGEHAGRVIELQGESCQIDADPIASGGTVLGVALFFFNVTEKERAEQMRREFTANVSHELKTPLHAISGYAELLRNDMVKSGDIIPFAGKIYDEAQRMVSLVEDIISLSHLDEGADGMKREKIDLYELAEKTIHSLEPEAKAARVTLELSGMPATVNGIAQLLQSIVYNLCDNAIKYNRKNGKVIVSVRKEGEEAVFSVRDTGIGIAPEHRERIFERFYRVDKSRSKEVGGTGLGLSIVKHAAKIHDAEIEVDSVVGEGTEITVIFHIGKNFAP